MAYSTIPKGSLYMNNVLWTGNNTARTITGVNFQPDFTWIKSRTQAYNYILTDVLRGTTKYLSSNTNTVETTDAQTLTAFASDGFSIGTSNLVNQNVQDHIAWNWKGGGTGVANTNGSISSTVSASATSGFSIIKYTGSGANATVGHGLSTAPKMIIVKSPSIADDGWYVWNTAYSTSNNKYQRMEQAGGLGTGSTFWNDTAPTTSTISVGTSTGVNQNGQTYICYAFADVKGFSQIGGYTGNANADGTFVYTGFKPAFVMFKATASNESWQIYDTKRNPFNALGQYLNPNTSGIANNNLNFVDYLSNGFKLRTADGGVNGSQLYAYMAFASNPFVATSGTSAIPVTAR